MRARMPTLRSACPYDCPDTCGLLVDVEGGRAVRTRGDPEHPWSRGALCPKMTRYEATVHAPGRLRTPLLRAGPKGAGAFREASWDEALAAIVARWKAIVAADGAEAILPCSYAGTMGLVQRNAGHAFFHRLGASRLDRTICSPAKGAGWRAVMGDTIAPAPDEAAASDLVVLWGIHAVATNVHFLATVKEARARGAAVWVVDTWRSRTAALADEVVLVRPSSDGALALGLLHVLARDGLVDRAFVAAEVQGFEDLEREVLPRFTPERVGALTGLEPARVEDLARRYGRARAPFIRLGSGLSRYGNGAMNVRCVTCLPAAVGAWARPGGGLLASTSGYSAFDLRPVTREDLQPGPTRLVNMNRLGEALSPSFAPPVRSLYVYHSNPAAVAPDQNAVLAGLAREDLFTVVHERFLTDTARWADVVLPATSSLEHADLYAAYGHYAIQRARPVIPPVGEARSNWDVFRALARGMGFDASADEVFERTADEMIDRLLAVPSPWREGIDRGALDAGRAVALRVPPGPRWRTPSGRIEIRNPRLPRALPDHLPSHEDGGAGAPPLRLQTAPSVHTLNSSFMERDDLRARELPMRLRLGPAEAAARGLEDGAAVVAANERGEVRFTLAITEGVPEGVAVAEGVFWPSHAPGGRTVNALTSQRLTDDGAGSTFYDTRVEVRRAR
jgi:anaerobic selenocysteine-containing dehydrogenase